MKMVLKAITVAFDMNMSRFEWANTYLLMILLKKPLPRVFKFFAYAKIPY